MIAPYVQPHISKEAKNAEIFGNRSRVVRRNMKEPKEKEQLELETMISYIRKSDGHRLPAQALRQQIAALLLTRKRMGQIHFEEQVRSKQVIKRRRKEIDNMISSRWRHLKKHTESVQHNHSDMI